MVALQTEPGTPPNRSRRPAVIACTILGILLAGYLAVCGVAYGSRTFFPNSQLSGVELGGLTAGQAAQRLEKELPDRTCSIYINALGDTPDATVTFGELGIRPRAAYQDYADLAKTIYRFQHRGNFLVSGMIYLGGFFGGQRMEDQLDWDPAQFDKTAKALADELSSAPQDTSYELGDGCVLVHKSLDGRSVSADDLHRNLQNTLNETGDSWVIVPGKVLPAKTITAREIYKALSGEMKNAGYDAAAGTITPEKAGVEFDASEAAKLLAAAGSGAVVKIPAVIQAPTVTAEQLKSVLFRDALGTATTHVGGSAARISNVKLAAATLNGTVLNSGDVFSYNETVGQRTVAKGYQAAPAYVQGETVDEIGGGVCQPSSTLYLACLRSNLKIVERAAHRYVPAYIAKGMDATVSWGGPDYKFSNDTDYPIRISAVYAKGYLTMTLYGTKTGDTTVKMTYQVLSTTAFQTVYQNDGSLPAGTQTVKITPYTGYKVKSYRNLYDGNGSLISSKLEAVSNYKVRNKLILVGPEPSAPVSGSSSENEPPAGDEAAVPGTGADNGTGGGTGAPASGQTGDAQTGDAQAEESGEPAAEQTGDSV
jgi:vancomycin resistance protein YoaR